VHVALLTAIAGLLSPYLIRALTLRGKTPWLVVTGHLAGLLLAWAGVLSVVGVIVAPQSNVLAVCEVLLASLRGGSATVPGLAGLLVYGLLTGRGLWSAATVYMSVRSAYRDFRHRGMPRDGYLEVPDLGTVAVTVGLLRPAVAVDPERFGRLSRNQRAIVLAHERGHVRGWHPLIDLLVRALASGLAPWPGATVAHDEVRRYLEAAADDHAARVADRPRVARAIAAVAVGPAPVGLGASGWSLWRVERLLSAPRTTIIGSATGALSIITAGIVGLQGSAHALVGFHILPLLALACPT